MIKFLFERGIDEFLAVYRLDLYESPVLIWSKELRTNMEEAIRANTADFLQALKTSPHLPVFKFNFPNIIRQPTIENEVKCGRYYLRIWV